MRIITLLLIILAFCLITAGCANNETAPAATTAPVKTIPIKSTTPKTIATLNPPSVSPSQLSGNGDDVQSFTITGSGLVIFTMEYNGVHNFAIVLKDNNGEYIGLLANEIGSYSGKKSERLDAGKYYLDITASGPWLVNIETS